MAGNSRVVCIIGPGRAGTSLLARLLHTAGMDVGEHTSLAEPKSHNLTGDWEHPVLSGITQKILRRLGSTGNTPPDPIHVPFWLAAPNFDALRNEALSVIDTEFGRSDFWGWKDPPTTLVLPFWQGIIPRIRYIIAMRNPIDMVTSHVKLSGYSMERSYAIYFAYTIAALMHTRGRPRLITFYEDLLDHFDDEFERILKFVEIDPRVASEDAIRAAVRKDLRHTQTATDEMLRRTDVPSSFKMLFATLYAAVEMQKAGDRSFDGMGEAILAFLPSYLLREWRTGEPLCARAWRSISRLVPLNLRATRVFYDLNRMFEVLSQEGTAGFWRDAVKRVTA